MKRLVLASALAALAVAAQAEPVTYVIDSTHTFPSFSYNHLGFSTQTHRFNGTTGSIVVDRAAKTGSAEVSIDAKSVDAGSVLFNEHIQAADFFDTAHYPTLGFKGTKMQFKGDKPVSISGDITIKGVTRPITFDITAFNCAPHPMLKVEACGANAVAKLKRSDFNMGKNAPYVSDEVTLNLSVEARKQQ